MVTLFNLPKKLFLLKFFSGQENQSLSFFSFFTHAAAAALAQPDHGPGGHVGQPAWLDSDPAQRQEGVGMIEEWQTFLLVRCRTWRLYLSSLCVLTRDLGCTHSRCCLRACRLEFAAVPVAGSRATEGRPSHDAQERLVSQDHASQPVPLMRFCRVCLLHVCPSTSEAVHLGERALRGSYARWSAGWTATGAQDRERRANPDSMCGRCRPLLATHAVLGARGGASSRAITDGMSTDLCSLGILCGRKQ